MKLRWGMVMGGKRGWSLTLLGVDDLMCCVVIIV
jgi:hypothetical protein